MQHFTTLFFVCIVQVSCGQSLQNLRGKVVDENNSPISSVHIRINNSTIGTISNTEGLFNLKVPKHYCGSKLVFTHVSYATISKIVDCGRHDYHIILSEKIIELEGVEVSVQSVEQIVLNAILNLKKNYQIDSVNYTLFSRVTEQIENEPLLVEEFVFNLYHESNTRPEFNIIKVRGQGFKNLGKHRYNKERLTVIHVTESHLMLRFIPDFLKKRKMKRYEYTLIDEISSVEDPYFVIAVTSNQYLKGGVIHVSKKDFGISYIKKLYKDEHWNNMSTTNRGSESYYIKDNGKWYFTHGTRQRMLHLKKEDAKINIYHITLTTMRTNTRLFEKEDEMGLMTQMLRSYKGNFSDDFWEQYNYIPLNDKFRRALTLDKR